MCRPGEGDGLDDNIRGRIIKLSGGIHASAVPLNERVPAGVLLVDDCSCWRGRPVGVHVCRYAQKLLRPHRIFTGGGGEGEHGAKFDISNGDHIGCSEGTLVATVYVLVSGCEIAVSRRNDGEPIRVLKVHNGVTSTNILLRHCANDEVVIRPAIQLYGRKTLANEPAPLVPLTTLRSIAGGQP